MDLSNNVGIHDGLSPAWTSVNGGKVVLHYSDHAAEHACLWDSVGIIDLGFRTRLCLLGADRIKFFHGQVTNDVQGLEAGEGCYAFVGNAKGRIQADMNIYRLADEILIDAEPGLTESLIQRLDQYVIADDVQIVDAAPHYGLLSVQGPKAVALVEKLELGVQIPSSPLAISHASHPVYGEVYLSCNSRVGTGGFDLFVPLTSVATVFEALVKAAPELGGRACGWQALETARIEAGIPRFGQDMDDTNLAPETGQGERAISYSKGCYIGQEVIARIRTYGQVTKELRGLRLSGDDSDLPAKGCPIFHQGKEVGYITSAVWSPRYKGNIALGYVRKECNHPGSKVQVGAVDSDCQAEVMALPMEQAG